MNVERSAPRGAVFLSYAREDTPAAQRIAEALRSHGVEVWFDQDELRGGDAWDGKIKKQIRDCTLFLPLVSKHTQERSEGYFRREWLLAVERTRDMHAGVAFIVPVVIDETREADAAVPEEFMRYQWTRLPRGLPTPQFVEQVSRLLEAPRKAAPSARAAGSPASFTSSAPVAATPHSSGLPKWLGVALGTAVLALVAYVALRPAAKESTPLSKSAAETKTASAPTPSTPAASALGEKSIAVLPFANLSSEKENEFFADGVQDDVITSLAKIRDLTVISRTSTLAYRDAASRNLKKIAGELGVATVLEGSVRRVGSKVHMNAQLIDARTDAHLWADTFDGDTGDIFALQASLAQKIAAALKATLTPSELTLIERRPTENQEAYELYSRARLLEQALSPYSRREEYGPIVSLYEQAVAKDPAFALAHAQLSIVHGTMFWFGAVDATPERRARAEASLEAARRLAPNAPETHFALGAFAYLGNNDWKGALAEYAIAEPSLPNDAQLQYQIGIAHRRLAQWPEAAARFERATTLNPHDLNSVSALVDTTQSLRRYAQTRTLAARYLAIFPDDWRLRSIFLRAQFALDGDRVALAKAWSAPHMGDDERARLQAAYETALFAGDLDAAERSLADPRLLTLTTTGGITVEPAALHRAIIAFHRSQRETAIKFSDEALAFYRSRTWTPRQQPMILLAIAQAEACAGRAEASIRDGHAAMAQVASLDPYVAVTGELQLGRIYATLDRRDDALASLAKVMGAAETVSPQEVRIDPLWSRLKDDPRFEEILKSAKPL